MELSLKIPDELKARLQNREAQLVEILELGLEVIEERSPTPEELVAYSRRELDEEAREELAERLALDKQAVDDLLDFEHFDDLQPPSEAHRLSDSDVKRALETLRGRIAAGPTGDASPGAAPASETVSAPARIRRWRTPLSNPAWLGLAAGLLIAIGIWSTGWRSDGSAAVRGYPVQISNSRATSVVYTAPATAETIQLILEPAGLAAGVRGRLVISAVDGRQVFEESIRGADDPGSLLFIPLPSDKLPSGRYRIEIFAGPDGRSLTDWTFTLERTSAEPRL